MTFILHEYAMLSFYLMHKMIGPRMAIQRVRFLRLAGIESPVQFSDISTLLENMS